MSDATAATKQTPATVALLAGGAGERFGQRVAARHKVQARVARAHLRGGRHGDRRGRPRPDRPRDRARGPGRDPGRHPPGVDAGQLRDHRRRSGDGARCIRPTPRASVNGCSATRAHGRSFCENAAQRAKIDQVAGELPDLRHTIGIEPGAGELTLSQLRERAQGHDRSELVARQSAVAPEDPYTIIYTSGTTGPPKGVVLTHRNAMSVCEMVAGAEVRGPRRAKLSVSAAGARLCPHRSARFLRPRKHDHLLRTRHQAGSSRSWSRRVPTYLPSVPRIFEKLYTAAMKMREQASEADRERFEQAVKLGVEVRRRRQRGEPVPDELEQAFQAADERLYARVRALFGGEIDSGRHRRRADRPRDPRVLLRVRRAGARRLGHDRDGRRRHRGHA